MKWFFSYVKTTKYHDLQQNEIQFGSVVTDSKEHPIQTIMRWSERAKKENEEYARNSHYSAPTTNFAILSIQEVNDVPYCDMTTPSLEVHYGR